MAVPLWAAREVNARRARPCERRWVGVLLPVDRVVVVGAGLAPRARGERDLAVLFGRHGPSLGTPVEVPDLLSSFRFRQVLAARARSRPAWSLTSHSTYPRVLPAFT